MGNILIMCSFLSCGTSNNEGTKLTIHGEVEQIVPGGWVRLEKIEEQKIAYVDSALVETDGAYKLIVTVDEPSFYRLNFNNRQHVMLILTGKERTVEVNAAGNNPQGFSEVSGSYDTQYMRDMDELTNNFQKDVQRINWQAGQARASGDLVTFQALSIEYQELSKESDDRMKKMVWNAVPSLAAYYGIQRLNLEQNFPFFDSVSIALSRALPNNYISKKLFKMVEAKRSLTIGSEAPEIALPDPDGKIIRLSSLRGNYVLIDFWAAWCRPCRVENPNVVRVYKQYQKENFEILGVSLDRKREAWIQAIKQDGLPWKHISDLKYFNSVAARTYQIDAIPTTYLINPEGKIIAKNLRGQSLIAKLKEIFG